MRQAILHRQADYAESDKALTGPLRDEVTNPGTVKFKAQQDFKSNGIR
jgi:hypothetical protein